MLKVVTMISVLHKAEEDPSLLSKQVTVQSLPPASGIQDFYPPADPIKAGVPYTVNDLMGHMILESDNTAALALENLVGSDETKNTFAELKLPDTANADDSMTVQEYSHVFRVLFSSTYLDHAVSEQALDLLSQTSFTQGLVAGVPTGTVVSHKFGERTIKNENITGTSITLVSMQVELHDCGIVYYPNNPYFICVMTKGGDFSSLAGAIKDISKMVWDKASTLN